MNATPSPPILFDQKLYSLDELADVFGQISTTLASSALTKTDPTLSQIVAHFEKARDGVTKGAGRAASSGSNDAVIAADQERDNLWMGLCAELEAKVRLRDPNRRAAAVRLQGVFTEQFDRRLHALNLEENSAALDRVFEVLDGSKESQGDLALLGLAIDWYVPLKEAHRQFKEVSLAANLDKASQKPLLHTRVAGSRASRKVRLIIDLCEDHAEEGHQDWITLHAQLGEVIGKVRAKAKGTQTRQRNKKAKSSATALTA